MRLNRLTIKNLASIENATVDFSKGILADEPLFLICGPTGAGKTTILDAICLALYNNTPRYNQSKNEKYFASQGEDAKSVSIKDVSQIMRRNTAEAMAELSFIGNDGNEYVATWSVQRARKKVAGAMQAVKRSLLSVADGKSYNTVTEVGMKIQELVGLDFEQFCRTTMLAQGDFTQFLKSDEKDKSAILEKLTGNDVYSKIGKRIYELTVARKSKYDTLQTEIGAVEMLTDERKTEIESDIAALEQTIAKRKEDMAAVKSRNDWMVNMRRLEEALSGYRTKFAEIAGTIASEDFIAKENILSDWRISIDARNALSDIDIIKKDKVELEAKEAENKKRFIRLIGSKKYYLEQQRINREQLLEVQNLIDSKQKIAPMLEQADVLITKLRGVLRFTAQSRENALRKEAEIQRLPELEKLVKDREELLKKLNSDLDNKREVLKTLKDELDSMSPGEIANENEELNKRSNLLNIAISCVQALIDTEKDIKRDIEEENRLSEAVKRLEADMQKLESDVERLKRDTEALQESLQKVELAANQAVEELRHSLKVGDICPVCGSNIDKILSDETFESIFAPVRVAYNAKKAEYDAAVKAYQENMSSLKSGRDLLARAVKAREKDELKGLTQTEQAMMSCTNVSVAWEGVNTMPKLIDIKFDNNSKLEQFKKRMSAVEQMRKQIDGINVEIDTLYKSVTQAQQNSNKASVELEAQKAEITKLDMASKSARSNADEEFRIVSGMILWDSEVWQAEWEGQPDAFISKIEEEARELKRLGERNLASERESQMLNINIDTVSRCIDGIVSKSPERASLTPEVEEPIDDLSRFCTELLSDESSLSQQMQNNRMQLERNYGILTTFYAQHTAIDENRLKKLLEYNNAVADEKCISDVRKEFDLQRELITNGEKELKELESAKPVFADDETSASVLEEKIRAFEEVIQVANRDIGSLKTLIEEDNKKTKSIKDKILKSNELYDEWQLWEKLRHLFGGSNGEEFRKVAQSYVLNILLKHANRYLAQLSDRYSLECQPGSLTILIHDSYQNAHSGSSNLSGGESFLVSLSLALGLASLNRSSFSVDTLFIDEGFGTLSSEVLSVVMDTLMRLQQIGGRKVGIISHMDSLRESIKAQIQVNRIDNTRSRVDVVKVC